ncbi:hypothetical protein PMX39_25390 [Enterocloster clostridioformis]|uniref:hypothetical protein n=1 Tax=Enterocloster clostridioformis TaxID=1531 RepID=UPI00232B0669|nr:hypothetical protein [Enterocloster clostridioformis]MDB2135919.1 hypothetical protein [Enterocloster clostridioformis]
MATVDEILTRQAYADGDESWTKDDNYPAYRLYVEPEYVPVANKRIADFNDQISVRGEQNARFVGFQMPRYDNGLDLTAQHLYIHYQTVYGGGDGVPCNVSKSDSHVRMCWQVPAQATQEPGTIQMMIYATGTNSAGERVTWKTLPASYTIHDGLDIGGGIPEPDTSWYEQFVAQMEGKVSTAQGYANDAQASKTAAAGSATASAQSATASAQALADNKAYVESQKAAFVGYNKRETDLKYANALIGSATDTMHVTVDDAWEAPIPGLEIAGKSEQGADPSPEYPQEIVSTDVTAVTVTGAQMLKESYISKAINGLTVTENRDGSLSVVGTSTATTSIELIKVDNTVKTCFTKGGEYYFSLINAEYNPNTCNICICYDYNGTKYFIPGTKKIPAGSKYKSCTLWVDSGVTVNLSHINIMLNIGTTPLPWEPYQSKTASITLTKPLRGIGDYRDEITMTNRIDRCMELTFDGSEDCWGVYTSGSRTGFSAINVLPISMNNRNGICNQALVGGNEEVERIILGSNNQNLYYFYCPFYDATIADKGLSAWKAHLAAHPLKVVTYLDTPVETDLEADTIAALAELTTYKGRTTTTVTAEGPEPDVTLEYVQDTRMVIADLQAQINEIRNGGTT